MRGVLVEATQRGRERLRDCIMEIKRSGLSWAEIGSTLRSYAENGVPANPQDATLARLDRLMGWKPGSSRVMLDGGEPTPADPVPPHEINDRAVALMRRVASLANEAADLLEDKE